MALGKHMFLDAVAVLSARRRVLLLAALSFFWPSSSTLSNRPDCHSRRVDSDALLFEPASRLLSLDRISSYSCSMLSRWANQPGVYRFVQLRCLLRLLLLRGTELLSSYPRDRSAPASPAIAWI